MEMKKLLEGFLYKETFTDLYTALPPESKTIIDRKLQPLGWTRVDVDEYYSMYNPEELHSDKDSYSKLISFLNSELNIENGPENETEEAPEGENESSVFDWDYIRKQKGVFQFPEFPQPEPWKTIIKILPPSLLQTPTNQVFTVRAYPYFLKDLNDLKRSGLWDRIQKPLDKVVIDLISGKIDRQVQNTHFWKDGITGDSHIIGGRGTLVICKWALDKPNKRFLLTRLGTGHGEAD